MPTKSPSTCHGNGRVAVTSSSVSELRWTTPAPVREEAARHHGGSRATDERHDVHGLERGERERCIEPGFGCDRDAPRAEIGVGAGLRDDGEAGIGDDLAVRQRDVETLPASVVATKPGVERGRDIERMREVALQRPAALDPLDDGGVEPDARGGRGSGGRWRRRVRCGGTIVGATTRAGATRPRPAIRPTPRVRA